MPKTQAKLYALLMVIQAHDYLVSISTNSIKQKQMEL